MMSDLVRSTPIFLCYTLPHHIPCWCPHRTPQQPGAPCVSSDRPRSLSCLPPSRKSQVRSEQSQPCNCGRQRRCNEATTLLPAWSMLTLVQNSKRDDVMILNLLSTYDVHPSSGAALLFVSVSSPNLPLFRFSVCTVFNLPPGWEPVKLVAAACRHRASYAGGNGSRYAAQYTSSMVFRCAVIIYARLLSCLVLLLCFLLYYLCLLMQASRISW